MCPTKEDLREITRDPSGIDKLHMVEKPRAYYLIQGALRYSMMNLTTS